MMQILYFGRLREVFGRESESLALPTQATVAGLLLELRSRGGIWAEELSEDRKFRVAVDQTIARQDVPLETGSEVAIFPPVTGG